MMSCVSELYINGDNYITQLKGLVVSLCLICLTAESELDLAAKKLQRGIKKIPFLRPCF